MNAQETIVKHKTSKEDKIGFSQLAAYGAGGIIPIALFNVAGMLVGLMGNISLGLNAFWLGVILIIPRLWDAVSDPLIGHISDNTRTRWGRRRPFLLIGGILVAVTFVLMWWIPKGDMVRLWFPSDAGFQWFQLSYILFTLLLFYTACTIFEIPHGALGMEMTTDSHERTRLFSAKSFVGNLFAMSTPWLFALASMEIFKGPGGNEADGMRYVSIMVAAIIIPLSFWWTYKLREPGFVRVSKQEKTPFWKDMKNTASNKNFIFLTLTIFTLAMGFNFVNLLGSYIPIFYIFGGDKVAGAYLLGINGTVWAITGLLAVFPLNWISPKLGKRSTLVLAILLMSSAQLSKIVCYNPSYPYLIIIPTILLSAGMLFFFTLGSSMVGDICDEDDLKTGYRTEGSFYSVFWWFIKMGTALASFVAGALIVFTMFDQTQVTKVDDIQGSIKEMRSKVQSWQNESTLIPDNSDTYSWINSQHSDALEESKGYLTYLKKESEKWEKLEIKNLSELQGEKRAILTNAATITESTVKSLEGLKFKLPNLKSTTDSLQIDVLDKKIVSLALQTKLVKARVYAFELLMHLETKSLETKKSKEHYDELMENIEWVNSKLASIDASEPLSAVDQSLSEIEDKIVVLKKQSPYTLLRMRIVEIGLPLFLCIFSLFFILRYTLTEKRSLEIKELLKQRNLERDSMN
ncbi:MAG: MFS transporter [Bacteroidales bacterium]|nr:MFS transporter [Bacteroidales bacterium]MDD4671732.1 MFS transporter [Bacteroidales bacterium]MDY0348597.1 MFS transporter [Tenuifilaceae bacterium]